MKLKKSGELLEITTEAYQARSGAIILNWGNTVIKLSKDDAEVIANEVPEIDREAYTRFYNPL